MKSFVEITVALVILLTIGCYKPVKVEGRAMLPTLADGDRVLMSDDVSHLKRFDIVSFKYPNDQTKFYIKRIIGLPGERVEISQGKVLIDGNVIDEPYLDPSYNTQAEMEE